MSRCWAGRQPERRAPSLRCPARETASNAHESSMPAGGAVLLGLSCRSYANPQRMTCSLEYNDDAYPAAILYRVQFPRGLGGAGEYVPPLSKHRLHPIDHRTHAGGKRHHAVIRIIYSSATKTFRQSPKMGITAQ